MGKSKERLFHNGLRRQRVAKVPRQLLLNARKEEPGFFFGGLDHCAWDNYVGLPQGADGHIMVVGGSGSGKSSGIIMPTLRTWQGAICATDLKGELSDYYKVMYQQGYVSRPYLVFDPLQADSPSYDPFGWLQQDNSENLVSITFAEKARKIGRSMVE